MHCVLSAAECMKAIGKRGMEMRLCHAEGSPSLLGWLIRADRQTI